MGFEKKCFEMKNLYARMIRFKILKHKSMDTQCTYRIDRIPMHNK